MFDEKPDWGMRLRYAVERGLERVADLWAAVVRPFEWTLGFLTFLSLRVIEIVENAGSLLTAPMRWAAAAWCGLGRALHRGVAAIPLPLRQALMRPMFVLWGVQQRLVWSVMVAAESLNFDRALWWAIWFAQPLWRPIAAVVGFLNAWFVTRDWGRMAWGVPALLLLAPFAAVLARSALHGNDEVASQYQQAVRQAAEAGDYARMDLYERKLAQLGVTNRRSEFKAAFTINDEGDFDAAC
ncbi:MAG: hypothetical protein KDA61_22335, partial [Planctomycetales bacterium]|nr:hypothetical protein [Planctomycetales bacterium]